MEQILNLIKQIMKSDVVFTTDEQRLRPSKSEVFRLWGDNTLINSLTGWQPEYDIESGLQKTIQWFLKAENFKKYKACIYNV